MNCSIFLAALILFLCISIHSSQESPSPLSNLKNQYYAIDNSDAVKIDSQPLPASPKRFDDNRIPKGISQSFNQAVDMLNLVSKLSTQTNEVYDAATKFANKNGYALADPVTFIPTIIIYGAVKALSYLVSMFIYVSSLVAPWQIDPNAKLSFIDLESLHNIDYELISNSVRSVPERSFKLLDIKEEQCKTRAMCEIGQHIHSYWPKVATYIRLAVEQLNINDNNTVAILRGLGWADCDSLFRQSCQRSPFGKFYQIFTSLNKLLSSTYDK